MIGPLLVSKMKMHAFSHIIIKLLNLPSLGTDNLLYRWLYKKSRNQRSASHALNFDIKEKKIMHPFPHRFYPV